MEGFDIFLYYIERFELTLNLHLTQLDLVFWPGVSATLDESCHRIRDVEEHHFGHHDIE